MPIPMWQQCCCSCASLNILEMHIRVISFQPLINATSLSFSIFGSMKDMWINRDRPIVMATWWVGSVANSSPMLPHSFHLMVLSWLIYKLWRSWKPWLVQAESVYLLGLTFMIWSRLWIWQSNPIRWAQLRLFSPFLSSMILVCRNKLCNILFFFYLNNEGVLVRWAGLIPMGPWGAE